jgi:hypothetical protein
MFGFVLRGRKPLVVDAVDVGSPAQLANIYPNDVIISVDGLNVEYTPHRHLIEILKLSGPITTLEVRINFDILSLLSIKFELTS